MAKFNLSVSQAESVLGNIDDAFSMAIDSCEARLIKASRAALEHHNSVALLLNAAEDFKRERGAAKRARDVLFDLIQSGI